MAQTRNGVVSISELKKLEEYREAKAADGYLLLGRAEHIAKYRNHTKYPEYIYRVLNPERRKQSWSLERNMAFWAGGIETGKKFLILTPLKDILGRAQKGMKSKQGTLGGAVKELLWLKDNGYTFEEHSSKPHMTWAIPPTFKKQEVLICHYDDNAKAADAFAQTEALEEVVRSRKEKEEQSTYNPRKTLAKEPTTALTNFFSRLNLLAIEDDEQQQQSISLGQDNIKAENANISSPVTSEENNLLEEPISLMPQWLKRK